MPTQLRLRKLFDYNPETGQLRWKHSTSHRVRIGATAGYANKTGHLTVRVDTKLYLVHRLVWIFSYGKIDRTKYIDHIDHNPSNNALANLRLVTREQNQRNMRFFGNNPAGMFGLQWNPQNNNWRARINIHDHVINLGSFKRFEDAVAARKAAEVKYGFHPNHGKRDVELRAA